MSHLRFFFGVESNPPWSDTHLRASHIPPLEQDGSPGQHTKNVYKTNKKAWRAGKTCEIDEIFFLGIW